MKWIIYLYIDYTHRIRIYTEEKAKAVAGVWGTKCIQFLVALAILHQVNLKNRMNSSFSSYHSGAIHPFPHIILVSEKLVRLNIEKILSPKQQRRPLPSLLSLSFFYEYLLAHLRRGKSRRGGAAQQLISGHVAPSGLVWIHTLGSQAWSLQNIWCDAIFCLVWKN